MKIINQKIIDDLQLLFAAEHQPHLTIIGDIVQAKGDDLATSFYEAMLSDADAVQFLSHDMVKTRLHSSLKQWMLRLFRIDNASDIQTVVAHQIKIGEVHARIDVPVHVVLRGARCLKDNFRELPDFTGFEPLLFSQCTRLFNDLIDIAMEMMSQAYAFSHDRAEKNAEAFRLFSVYQNLSVERDKQKAALLDWESMMMFNCAVGTTVQQLPLISNSDFGLWYRHKGVHAFQGSTEAGPITETMQRIDNVLRPLLLSETIGSENYIALLRDLRSSVKNIIYCLETLFEQNSEMESGKDVLTRLFNRKFLPAVLSREIQHSRKNQSQFALLSLDIDHFKKINDAYGHEAGDMVLQQIAALLSNICRGGDFIFRMGGEEFLIVLVDINEHTAFQIAEKIRKRVASETFLLPKEGTLHLTISIGLSLYDEHPDFQLTLRRSDNALYQAKANGRNQVVAADLSIAIP